MRARILLHRTVLVAAVAAAPIVVTGAAQAAGHGGTAHSSTACATVKVRATPKINTAMVAETITSTVTSCATATETVTLTQHISGPTRANAPTDKTWSITLSPGQSVTKVRHFPYACCGSYHVSDKVASSTGTRLANAGTGFTFA